MRPLQGMLAATIAVVGLAVLSPADARAHETTPVGELTVTIGWAEEPAYVGMLNAVEVGITNRDGEPPDGLEAALVVEVLFGAQSISLPLDPQQPERFLAPIMPTRTGTYTFSISGRINGEHVTITSQCGPATFDCVSDLDALQFPERDPSIADVAARLDQELSAPRSPGDATSPSSWPPGPTLTAAVALVLALGALGVAFGRRGGSRRSRTD